MSSLGSFLWALCRHEPLHLGVYLPFSTHFCLTNAFQMLQSEPQNAKYNSVPDVQSPLFLASVGCQLTSLNEASHSILLGTPQRTTAKSQNVAWRHSTVYVTNACLRTTEDSVIVWIPKQPDENIPTWRSKICKKATGPRKIEGLELFWATTSCRKKKQYYLEGCFLAQEDLPQWSVAGASACPDFRPTWKLTGRVPTCPTLSSTGSSHESKVSPKKWPWANFWFQSLCFSL